MNAVILFVSACVAFVSAASTGGGYEPTFPKAQVQSVEEYLHKVASEKLFLKDRINALKGDKTNNLKKLQEIVDTVLPGFNEVNDDQNSKLQMIATQLKELYHRYAPLAGQLNAQERVVQLQINQLAPLRDRINHLEKVNNEQDAALDGAEAALGQAAETINEKLNAASQNAENQVNALVAKIKASAELVDSRRCYNQFVEVVIDYATFEGQAKVNFTEGFFGGNIPTTACFVQGFVSKINLGESKPTYGYAPPKDLASTVDFAVDCLPGTDGVYVRVFDKSQGSGNAVVKAYVETKSCSLPPVAGSH